MMSTGRRRKRVESTWKGQSDAMSPEPRTAVRRSSRNQGNVLMVADPEIVAQWISVGVSRELSSDADIASFLLSVYADGRQTQSGTRCVSCNALLVLSCLSCQQSSSQAPPLTPLQSSQSLISKAMTINSQLSSPTPPLPQADPRCSSSGACPSDSSGKRDAVTQKSDPSDVSQECKPDVPHSDEFVNPFPDAERQTGSHVSDEDGEETDECPQETEPEECLEQGVESRQRKKEQESSAHDGKTEHGEVQEHSARDFCDRSSPVDAELYVCPHCSLVLPSTKHKAHVRTHHTSPEQVGAFSCPACAKTFPHFHTLYSHVRLYVSDQRCRQCDAMFVSGCQITKHRKQHERQKARFCEHCRQSFPAMSKKDFDRHLKKHEKKKKGKPAEAVLCPQCGKVFKKKEDLNHHLTYHSNDSPFPCPLCHKAFKNKVCLRQHQLVHGEKTQQCEVCGAKFHRKVGLRRHMQKHTGKQYACDECTRRFFSQAELLVHVEAVHKGIRRFPCTVCQLKFHKAASLKIHMRTHTGERPFGCDKCPARFAVGEALRKHLRRHTGEKPYCCEDCGQAYSCQYSYKLHRKKQHSHSLYACHDCQQAFVVHSSLAFHRKMCHGGNYDVYRDNSLPSDQTFDHQGLNLLQ